MPRATREFETDLAELAYQIGRSEAFQRIVQDFKQGACDDQEAQERILELLDFGRCKFQGDRGPEAWAWVLSERESGSLAAALYRDGIEG